jgi:predicted phosphodiesterase
VNINDLSKLNEESELQYLWRIDGLIRSGKYKNWEEITPIVNKELYGDEEDLYQGESAFRKKCKYARDFYEEVFSKFVDDAYSKEIQVQKRDLERAKIQFRDERNAWQKLNYIDGRVEDKLNKLEEEIKTQGKIDYTINTTVNISSNNDLLVILSDLHIGQCFSSAFGCYNSDIAKERINQYLNEILTIQSTHDSENVYVSLQGDMISNSIHKALAVTNRENVIQQIKLASEMVASFIYELSRKFKMVYMTSVTGNHSRIDRKEDALHDERLDSLIDWYVTAKLEHIQNVVILEDKIDSSISILNIRGLTYLNVHGDFDGFNKSGVADLVLMTGIKPYAITYGHLHTCSVDEIGGVKMIRGGSLAGSGDDYTIEKRLSGKPSQMVCVCTNKGVKAYYTVELN